jgi:predicted MFS family arabinose efflux permease
LEIKKINPIYLFFILVYANEGLYHLPSQAIYYLTRELWKLDASTMGWVAFIIGIPWCTKILFGFIGDRFPSKIKSLLIINYIVGILSYLYIIIFGLNLTSLIITGFLINFYIAFSDTLNDKQMVVVEQDGKLQGQCQAMQWSAYGAVSVLVSIFGAMLADAMAISVAYRVAYSIALILPILTLIYFFKSYKPTTQSSPVSFSLFKQELKLFKSKNFLTAILFIAFLQLSPSFGNPLMIYARENLHVNKMFLGYLGATGEVLSLIGYLIYYKYCQKFDLFKMLQLMIIGTVITNLFYLYIPNQWFLLGYNIAFGAFNGMSFLILLNFFVQLVPKNSEGFFYSCLTGISNLCGNGSAVLGGYVFDTWGYSATVIVASLTTACCLFIIPYLKLGEIK